MVTTFDSDLDQWVEQYCAFGDHRTGTGPDRATTAWFAGELAALGGRVERHPFAFDRYEGEVVVTAGGKELESDLLYYEGVGTVVTSAPHVAVADAVAGHATSPALVAEIESARASGAGVVVVATDHPLGELTMPNRAPAIGGGLPVALVAGRHRDELDLRDDIAVELAARIVAGESENVIARFGDRARRPVVLATPLSGWFTCAGERASGIAVLLGLVDRLRDLCSLVVVGASGHELLPHHGLATLLRQPGVGAIADDPVIVVHLGANVAVATADEVTGELALAPGSDRTASSPASRGVLARLPGIDTRGLDPLAAADLRPVVDPPAFLGEGALWASATDAPLLSFVGASPWFHTTGDVAERTVDPAGLVTVTHAIATTIAGILEVSGV